MLVLFSFSLSFDWFGLVCGAVLFWAGVWLVVLWNALGLVLCFLACCGVRLRVWFVSLVLFLGRHFGGSSLGCIQLSHLSKKKKIKGSRTISCL